MVDRMDPLPVTRQCELLDLPRSTFYHVPKPVSDEELELMALMDRCHLKHPFYGSRRIRDWLEDRGHQVNRKKVRRLMRTMGLTAQYPKRNLSLANQAHKVYPYLLRNRVIDRPNQVWATDITFIPMARGFVYLVAIMDWYSRKVLSWRVSNTLDASFCVDASPSEPTKRTRNSIKMSANRRRRTSPMISLSRLRLRRLRDVASQLEGCRLHSQR
jgi:putative transposase